MIVLCNLCLRYLCLQCDSDYVLHSGVLVHVYHDSVSLPVVAVHQIVAPVDYVIEMPDRCKSKRVCHVNLLKSIMSN